MRDVLCVAGFWGGAFCELVASLGGDGSVGVALGLLAVADMGASVVAGAGIDRGYARLALLVGMASFCAGLALIHFALLPVLAASGGSDSGGGIPSAMPPAAYVAAALMGCGDGVANTVALSRLGTLADAHGLLPREVAFQYFQVANVAMSSAAFVYAPAIPLRHGRAPWQMAILVALGLAGTLCFLCASPPPPPAKGTGTVGDTVESDVAGGAASGGVAERPMQIQVATDAGAG